MVGAGYIAVELAGILRTLGSDVSLLIRYDQVGTGSLGFSVSAFLKRFEVRKSTFYIQ